MVDPALETPDWIRATETGAWHLTGSQCPTCSAAYFPGRRHCVECGADEETRPFDVGGGGEIYSWTRIHVGAGAPYVLAYIDTPSGVRVMGRMDDAVSAQVAVGTYVSFLPGVADGELDGGHRVGHIALMEGR